MSSAFFAMLFRMKYIHRWALMRNTTPENLSEHAMETAAITHCLATLRNRRFGGRVDADRAALIGLFHDCGEIITGDLPTPVKYYSREMRDAFYTVEDQAVKRLSAMLPEDLREPIEACMSENGTYERKIVKAADRISAYTKCIEEQRAGNHEFDAAALTIRESIDAIDLPEVKDFMREMVPAFALTLDELNNPEGC